MVDYKNDFRRSKDRFKVSRSFIVYRFIMARIRKVKLFIVSLTLFLFPFFVFAQDAVANPKGIHNPLSKLGSVKDVLLALLNIVVQIGVIAVVFFIVFAGFKMVWARGNPEELAKAKNILWYTMIGGAVVLGAEAILQLINNTIDQLR